MHMGVVVVTHRLEWLAVAGRLVIMVMGVRVVAQMLAVRRPAFQNVANPDPGRTGGVEGNDEGEQESKQETHGAHYNRRRIASRRRRLLQLQFDTEAGDGGAFCRGIAAGVADPLQVGLHRQPRRDGGAIRHFDGMFGVGGIGAVVA